MPNIYHIYIPDIYHIYIPDIPDIDPIYSPDIYIYTRHGLDIFYSHEPDKYQTWTRCISDMVQTYTRHGSDIY